MIQLDQVDGLWTATIRREEKANALTKPLLAELSSIAHAAKGNARALVLTGTGAVFSAGADLNAVRGGLATDEIWEDLSGTIAGLPCLTIAALNGTLAGGAFGMALACDLRIAVPEARLFYPVMKLGFLPQPSDPVRLAALIGPARTKQILLAGREISAAEALEWGLVDKVVQRSDLRNETRALCDSVLTANPDHVAEIKAMIR